MPTAAGGRGSPAARLRRCGLRHRGPRQGRAVRHPRQAAVLRARGARAEPRISRGLCRPHHADRSHRRAAVLVGRPDDRLYARGRGPARPLLRSVRRRSRLPPDRLGRARSAAPFKAPDHHRVHHRQRDPSDRGGGRPGGGGAPVRALQPDLGARGRCRQSPGRRDYRRRRGRGGEGGGVRGHPAHGRRLGRIGLRSGAANHHSIASSGCSSIC